VDFVVTEIIPEGYQSCVCSVCALLVQLLLCLLVLVMQRPSMTALTPAQPSRTIPCAQQIVLCAQYALPIVVGHSGTRSGREMISVKL
jgi:hypothetical protein